MYVCVHEYADVIVCVNAEVVCSFEFQSCCMCVCMRLSPVARGGDEVEAAVHSVVLDVLPVQPALLPEVLLKLLVHIVHHLLPAEEPVSLSHHGALRALAHGLTIVFFMFFT